MNKIHSKVWNKELGQLVVASEFASSDSAGVVQGAGTAARLRTSLLAAVVVPLLAVAGSGSTAFAQEWIVTDGSSPAVIGDGGTVTFQGDANIDVAQSGEDQDGVIEVTLSRNLDVDSVTAGDSVLDDAGLVVDDGAGNVTTVGAGSVAVADGAGTTVIGGNEISVGGANEIAISGDTGTIGGLTNQTIDHPDFADGSGRAATEDQLALVNETANMGWHVSVDNEGAGDDNNVGPAGVVDFTSADGNIQITREETDLEFSLADAIEVADSVEVAGNTTIDGTGVGVGDDVHLGDTGLVIGDADGPRFTNDGISAGNQVVNGVADGVADTDAVNVRQLEDTRTKYYSVNDNGVVQGNYDNDGATGVNALAAGVNTQAEGANSVAIGSGAVASSNVGSELLNPIGANTNPSTPGDFAVAIGHEARALGNQTIAVGRLAGTGAMGSNNVLLGARAGENSETSNNIFLGERAGSGLAADPDGNEGAPFLRGHNVGLGMDTLQDGHGENNTAVGLRAGRWQEGSSNTHVGSFAGVAQQGDFNVNAGYFAGQYTDSRGSVNIGVEAGAGIPDGRVAADYAVSIGYQAKALDDRGVAIGDRAYAGALSQIAIGGEAGLNSLAVNSTAIGLRAGQSVTGVDNVALGRDAGRSVATGANVAIGTGAGNDVTARSNPAVGAFPNVTGQNVAIGGQAGDAVQGDLNVGIGWRAGRGTTGVANVGLGPLAGLGTTGDQNVAVGATAGQDVQGRANIAMGNFAGVGVEAANTISLGSGALGSSNYAIAIGTVTMAEGLNAIAVGRSTVADSEDGVAIGRNAQATHAGSVALGAESVTAEANPTPNGTVGGITYGEYAGNTPESVVSVGAEGAERQVTNVAAGRVSASSTDAINGSQLFATQAVIGNVANSVVTVLGGNAAVDVDGNITTSDIGNTGHHNVHDAIDNVNTTANMGWNISAEGGNATNVGPGGSVDLNNGDGNIVITKADDSNDVTFDLADNIELSEDGSVAIGDGTEGSTLDAGGLEVVDGGNSTAVGAGTIAVTDAAGTTTIGGNVVSVGGGNPIVISGDTGTIGGLTNTTFDPDGFTSGQAATEDQLKQVSDVANAGWNVSVDGEGAVADNNVGPAGVVDFSNEDGNISISRDGTDLAFELADDITVDSITAGDTIIDTTGVAIGNDVHLGNTGLVINGGPSITLAGIDAGNLVVTNVAAGTISATSTDAINGSQLHGMGDSIVNVIGGNAELNPDGTIVTSDIGGTGHDNIDDAIRSANEAANAGWTATDANGNAANIGPNGSVAFTGDGNISVAQTGEDNSGEVEITLNRDLDVDSITAGNTVIDTDGVQVGDDVHLGDTGLVIEGGPSVTTDGIDAGGQVISNVAAGVEDTDAANVGQLNDLASNVVDNSGRVTNLEQGAAGPFQVSQEAPVVAPTPTGANSAAGGSGADASGDNSTALGNQAVASGDNSTAVGQGAQATHDNSVALGQGSATTVGAQTGYDAAYVGSSDSAGEVNVGNRTVSGVAPGVAGTDAVNVDQLQGGVNHAVVTANAYTDQRIGQVQSDVWHLHGRVDELERDINAGVATAMAMRQAPYVAGATTYYAGFGAYKDQGALGVSLRRTSDNGRWSLEGGFSANRDGAGGYIGVSGVLGSK